MLLVEGRVVVGSGVCGALVSSSGRTMRLGPDWGAIEGHEGEGLGLARGGGRGGGLGGFGGVGDTTAGADIASLN